MGGTLPLCKRNPTDRVTGTVNAIGYLHLPLPDHLESNVRPNPSFSTPARKSSGEKTTPDVNSSSVNRLTPLSSSKKIPRSPTPPSHDLRVTHASSTPPSNGRSSSERRRRKNTPPMARHSSHDSGYDEISHITPKYSGRSDSPTYSGYSQQVLSINQTPNRPATAPDRKNRIAEQLNKLESLASTLQIDAESAVNKLNRKLQDRIEEKNEIPFVNSNQDSTDMVHPDTDKEIDQPPSRNRKIALNPKNLSNQSIAENKRSQLEDADVLLANLRRRLNEKKIAK